MIYKTFEQNYLIYFFIEIFVYICGMKTKKYTVVKQLSLEGFDHYYMTEDGTIIRDWVAMKNDIAPAVVSVLNNRVTLRNRIDRTQIQKYYTPLSKLFVDCDPKEIEVYNLKKK